MELNQKLDEVKKLYTVDEAKIDTDAVESNFIFQRKWHEEKLEEFMKEIPSGKLLDVACGSGGITFKLAKMMPELEIIGIDFNEEAIAYANSRSLKENKKLIFIASPAEKMNFKTNEFDSILMSDALDHFVEPKLVLTEAYRLLKKDGDLIISVGNYHSIFPLIENLWEFMGKGRKWKHQHLTHFTRKKIKEYLTEIGFMQIQIKSMHNTKPFFYPIGKFNIPIIENIMHQNGYGMTLLVIAKK